MFTSWMIFVQFGEALYKAGAYVLDELELNITRITHIFVVSVGEAVSHVNYLCFSPSYCSSVSDLNLFGDFYFVPSIPLVRMIYGSIEMHITFLVDSKIDCSPLFSCNSLPSIPSVQM